MNRLLILASMSVCLAVATAHGATVDEPSSVNLAGNFNGWNTGDAAFQLKPRDGRFELARDWHAGRYEFKFVFDGNWSRHWGLGDNGALEQPGRNVVLTVQRGGRYRLWLDTRERKWGFEALPLDKPQPVIRVFGADFGGMTAVLDAQLSLAREQHPIKSYTWNLVSAVNADAAQIRPISNHTAQITVTRPGTYVVALKVNDDELEATSTVKIQLGHGWTFRSGNGSSETSVPMQPMDGDTWGCIINPGTVTDAARIVSADGTVSHPLPKPNMHATTSDAPVLLQLNPHAPQPVTIHFEGWVEFVMNVDPQWVRDGMAVERVGIAGSFNGWEGDATPMWSSESGLSYRRIVMLPDGLHHYKFVINGATWVGDPTANPQLVDASGNSGVRVGLDPASLAPAAPNHIQAEAVKHAADDDSYCRRVSDELYELCVRTQAADVQRVTIELDGARRDPVELSRTESKDGFDFWSIRLLRGTQPLRYRFTLSDGDARIMLPPDADGWIQGDTNITLTTPDWAKTAVWYQIFPERFRNGDPTNDSDTTVPWEHAWFKPYKPREGETDESAAFKSGYREDGEFFEYIYDRRYGGDIQGIQQALPYLRELGVTAIYLNPIFLAESLHKYDASDYRHIDDTFGVKDGIKALQGETTDPSTWQWSASDRVFLEFLKEAHRQGFKVIIDGVFNHTGREFWAFQDIIRNGRKSEYVGWFDIKGFDPLNYLAWDKEDGALPRLKHDEAGGLAEPVRQHLFAVTRRWMDPDGDGDPSDGIDGWRLDVPQDININFWRDWRKLVKSINPDAYIVGEIWTEARAWLTGDAFDAVMNYEFAKAGQKFIINRKRASKPSEFGAQLEKILSWYAPQVNLVLQNLYDSHDTDRIASMAMNPDLEYDGANRPQDNGPNYNTARPTDECFRTVKLLTTFQMTFLGAPMVYYGNEIGMYGADDPTDRKPMLWPELLPYDDPDERLMPDVFDHFRRMIAIRRALPTLQLGAFKVLAADDATGMFAFGRALHDNRNVDIAGDLAIDDDLVVIVLNNSDRSRDVNVPVDWSNDATVLRLDDPAAFELVEPEANDPAARTSLKYRGGRQPWSIENGHIRGGQLQPRSGAIFVRRVSGTSKDS